MNFIESLAQNEMRAAIELVLREAFFTCSFRLYNCTIGVVA